jgi:hypothetical protein
MLTIFVNKQSMDVRVAKKTPYLKPEDGFIKGINYQNWKDKKDCQIDNPLSCNFVQTKPIPDRLLPSRARFRFSLAMQNYTIFLSAKKIVIFFSNESNFDYFCRKFLQAFNGTYLSATSGTYLSDTSGTLSPLSATCTGKNTNSLISYQ